MRAPRHPSAFTPSSSTFVFALRLPSPLDHSPHFTPARYLTADIPGIGGVLRQRPEDFLVDEVPAYQPSGEGEHIYMLVQKRGMATMEVVRVLAKHFGVRPGDVGYAGLKDKKAVTRQVFSVHTPGKKPEDFPSLQHDKVAILWVDLHANKLRRGHLKGNRFSIRVRGVPISGAFAALKVLRRLENVGVPNRFGAQRFGAIGNNHLIGRAILLCDAQGALNELLGPASMRDPAGGPDPSHQRAGRSLFAEGKYAQMLEVLPYNAEPERRVLRALLAGDSPAQALRAIDPFARQFYLSGVQSAVFNDLLDQRLLAGTLDQLHEGDVAFKHDSGAAFSVDQVALASGDLAGRLQRLEISPSGPLWGSALKRAGGLVDERELAALARLGLTPEHLDRYVQSSGDELKGARRAMRAPLLYPEVEAGADEHGPYVRCGFELPPGAFATTVMDEVMKLGAPPDSPGGPGEGAREDES